MGEMGTKQMELHDYEIRYLGRVLMDAKPEAPMIKRKSKKSVARKRTAARKTAQAAPRKAKRGYGIQPGQPTGREVRAMHRLQVLTERYIGEGLTPADARTRATEGCQQTGRDSA
jgi:hypothetical protein